MSVDLSSPTTFGDLLRRYRLAAGLTQEALAERTGLGVRSIQHLEGGAHRPHRETIGLLVRGLGLRSDDRDLFERTARPTAGTPGDRARRPAPRPNLPTPLTTFVGRARDVDEVRRLLLQSDVRLLTLTGPGGVGKTRLAVQVAASFRPTFDDGVFFVPLEHLSEPSAVLPAIAGVLDVRETAGRDLGDALAHDLREKSVLLVLDNFEQIAAAGVLLAKIIGACSRLKVLITSRIVLHLSGEQVVDVGPLGFPSGRGVPTAQTASRCEAVRLFVERARASKQAFALTDANAPLVVEVCRRLDGLPLALELAAARLRAMPLIALAAQLEQGLPLLSDGARDQPLRQRTLQDAIAWSYGLLNADEKSLFRRIGVCRTCSLEAVEEICGTPRAEAGTSSISLPPLAIATPVGVASLVDNSLLQAEETVDGEARYRMLETIRAFALERLAEGGEAAAMQRRHILYHLKLAEAAEPDLLGQQQARLLTRLDREHDNFRAALVWCEEGGYAEPGLRLAAALWWFWAVHGHVAEGRDWFARLLRRFPAREPMGRRAAVRAKALRAAGSLAEFHDNHAAARHYYEEALELFRRQGDQYGVAVSLDALGLIASRLGDDDSARALLEEAVDLARESSHPVALGIALYHLALVLHRQGEYVTARQFLEESKEVKRRAGYPGHVGLIQLMMGVIAQDEGKYEMARSLVEQSLELCREGGDRRSEGLALAHLGSIVGALGDYRSAHDHLSASMVVQQELGDSAGVAFVLDRFAGLAVARGQAEKAIQLAAGAAALRDALGTPRPADAQAVIDRVLEPARRMLEPSAALETWRKAWALADDEVISLALDTAEPKPISPVPTPRGRPSAILTTREYEVSTLIARGHSNRRIAGELVITEGTVANHVVHILNKLGCESRTQIAVWVTQEGRLLGETRAALH